MTVPNPTRDELDQAIIDASREYIAVLRQYPRDPAKIAASRAALDDLRKLRAELYG